MHTFINGEHVQKRIFKKTTLRRFCLESVRMCVPLTQPSQFPDLLSSSLLRDVTNMSRNVTMASHVTTAIEERAHWKLAGRLFRIDVKSPSPANTPWPFKVTLGKKQQMSLCFKGLQFGDGYK